MIKTSFLFTTLILLFSACQGPAEKKGEKTTSQHKNTIAFAAQTIEVDGNANEQVWKNQEWKSLDQNWLGNAYTDEDYSGKYKLAWDENYVYVLAQIRDDTLIDIHPDGLDLYWDDDCLEIFIDEDASGGNHQYNHQAFAYHISLDHRVTDMGIDSTALYFDDHVNSARIQKGNTSMWEASVKLFEKSFKEGENNTPVSLSDGKKIGFALAYCDNDTSRTRENFIGSEVVKGDDKNRGWIDAGIFRKYELKK